MFCILQAAHVGIGISGVEGLQAACASDYAIAQVCPGGTPNISVGFLHPHD